MNPKKTSLRSAIRCGYNEIPEDIPEGCFCLFSAPDPLSLPASPSDAEDAVFEHLRSFAEAFPFAEGTVSVPFSPDEDSDRYAHMCAIVRGTFRAAVYGRFYLLCDNIHTAVEYRAFCETVTRLFCELEEEKREFNGYIAKGAILTSPLGLLEGENMRADLLLADMDTLLPLICRKKEKETSAPEKEALEKRLEALFERSKISPFVFLTS